MLLSGESGPVINSCTAQGYPPDEGSVFSVAENHWATRMMEGMQIIFQDPFSATSQNEGAGWVKEPWTSMGRGESGTCTCRALEAVRLPVNQELLSVTVTQRMTQRVAIAGHCH